MITVWEGVGNCTGLCAPAGSAEADRASMALCVIPGVECPVGLEGLLVLGKGSGLLPWATHLHGAPEVLVNVVSLLQVHVPVSCAWDEHQAAANTLEIPGCCLQRWISPVRSHHGT